MKCVATTLGVMVVMGMFGVLNALADFTPQNAFTQDANTVMLSHFNGTLREEVTGLDWDFGEFDGTNKDLSGSYTNTPTFSNGYGKAAGQGIHSAGSGGNGGLRFSFTPFLNTQKWAQGTIEWWEVYQVAMPNTQNNTADFQMIHEGPGGSDYHKWTSFAISQERYDNDARIEAGYQPTPDIPADLVAPSGSLNYRTLLTAATGKNYIAGQERHHIAVTWGSYGLTWWIDGKKAWSNPANTGAVYNPYWSGMHYYSANPYDGFQDGAIYLGTNYGGAMSNQIFDEFRFSSVDRYSVPEPSIMALLALGILGLIRRK